MQIRNIPAYRFSQNNHFDLQAVQSLALLSYGQYKNLLLPEHWDALRAFLQNDETWKGLMLVSDLFVCEADAQLAGMGFLIPSGNPSELCPASSAQVRLLGVHPNHSGKGIAKQLTQRKETSIMLHTSKFMNAARHIYESAGFKILKEIPARYGKKYWIYKLDLQDPESETAPSGDPH